MRTPHNFHTWIKRNETREMSRVISGLFTTTYNELDSSETEELRGKQFKLQVFLWMYKIAHKIVLLASFVYF